jgi:cytochrome P450
LDVGEDIYSNANIFLPERWYAESDMVKEKSAFSPFITGVSQTRVPGVWTLRLIVHALGPYGCIGKPLALMQMRALVSKIVMEFDISFAPGENGSNLLERSRDHFTLGLADLNLEFKPRLGQSDKEELAIQGIGCN